MSLLARRARLRRLRRGVIIGIAVICTTALAATTQRGLVCGKEIGPIEVSKLEDLMQGHTVADRP